MIFRKDKSLTMKSNSLLTTVLHVCINSDKQKNEHQKFENKIPVKI